MKLDAEDIEAIAQRVVALQRESPVMASTADVFTREEAKAYAKKNSEGAFCAWCRAWGVKPQIRGRYSRQRLDMALQREAKKSA